MAVSISPPRTDPGGLADLATLWQELHEHHRDVSEYQPLLRDLDSSWAHRLRLYRRLLDEGGSYLTATDEDGRIVGYAMIALDEGADDTFEVEGGIADVVTLVVAGEHRSSGIGQALLSAAEGLARARGFDTVKIATMSGNDRARQFYEANGYAIAEHVLYRRV